MSAATMERKTISTPARATSGLPQSLRGPEKAAVLFLCLGEERGTTLMKRLSEDEIRKITHAMAGLGIIPAPSVEKVMREFGETVANGGSVVGSYTMAESMLRKVLPEDQVSSILREIRGPLQERDLWARFSALNETTIANYLRGEHDQTAAAILSNLVTSVAANVLPLLGEERMISILERMIRMDAVPHHMMRHIEEALNRDMAEVAAQPTAAEKEKRMAELFNRLDNDTFERLAPRLEEKMPDDFPAIRQKMFTFDDLVKLDTQSLVRVMRGVDGNTLPMALKGAKAAVLERFFAALPQRSRDMLEDELRTMGQVRARDVRAAQTAMLDCARQLAADEVIVLPIGAEEEELMG
ncbi:flagellar motor switch protein FliG [Roseivivax isoporae]|uniref:Flagellar motor switch protein FliG n=1 Tax=Roseivivax isoporae LMG 25204 TaxID=1449351 RepID=X7F844_9RHOB|nr:flagellar motor switch protein FliG [Roseivivax isoporae]ETX28903.1 flagellar motor protein [Roseivivax isoporae LMG 25204]